MSDPVPWLLLSVIPGVGMHRFQGLLRRFGSPEHVLNASLTDLMTVPGLGPQIAGAITTHRNHAFVTRQLKLARRHGVDIITSHDEAYPVSLRQIYDPPPLLFVRGRVTEVDEHVLGIVGTRRVSSYGRRMTERFCSALCAAGITIVSGLARGVDTIAHRTALAQKGRTVAVLGSGLDIPYPPENLPLMEQITTSGAVISEYPMGTAPDATNFPQRNRIISGMSNGVLIVEAGESSGALITARYALEQDREVFAVPGPLTCEGSRGTNKLIKEGTAKLVEDVGDILEELGPAAVLNIPSHAEIREAPAFSLAPEEKQLYKIISETPQHIDRLATSSSLPSSTILNMLLNLELKGAIRQLPGKMFVRE